MTAQELGIMIDGNINIRAFLQMIRGCEGTDHPNGYKYLFGSSPKNEKLFETFAVHPQKFMPYIDKSDKKLQTSAAGAYQITWTTWKTLKARLNLVDFGPRSQDIGALELIRETGGIAFIQAGKFGEAVNLVRKIWASLPGSGNSQPEKTFEVALSFYEKAGGSISYEPG